MNLPFGIVVVGCAHKKNLTSVRLTEADVPHIANVTPDYEYPKDRNDINDIYEHMSYNPLGAYRVSRGHKDAILKCTKDYCLVLEDDVKFTTPSKEWIQVITDNLSLADEYDLVLFHLRASPTKSYLKDDKYVVTTEIELGQIVGGCTVQKGLGAMVYLIGSKGRQKILESVWDGMPIDIKYTNIYKYAWISLPDLFIHDDHLGSMTDNPK